MRLAPPALLLTVALTVAAAPSLPVGTATAPGLTTADGPTSAVAADVAESLPGDDGGRLPGPAVLYDEAAVAPQLQNTGVWQADPLLVSGATAYRDGEWLYQDFLFDDHGARGVPDRGSPYSVSHRLYSPAAGTFTYPTGPGYVHNAADLVELRTRLVDDQLAFRVTLNSLVDPALSAFTIALGGQDDQPPVTWPHGSGVSSPAAHFLTVHGDELELLDATGDVLLEATATVDTVRRQIEARVPLGLLDTTDDTLRVSIGVGLWDAAEEAYLAPSAGPATATTPGGGGTGTALVNVGPRRHDQEPQPVVTGATMADTAAGAAALAAWWREQAQAEALALGDVSAFTAVVDLTKLREGVTDESAVPTTGALNRILASRYELGQGIDLDRVCFGISAGIDVGAACEGRLVGQLQPYTIHVPRDMPRPADGWGLTLLLHSLSANHNQYAATNNAWQLAERGAGHLVVTPSGRGPDGFYKGFAEADTFEVWNDVARHYDLDADVAAVSGYSMGGFGTYRLLARWPDLFAAGFSVVAEPGTVDDQLASLRNHRLLAWNAAADELVNAPAAEEAHAALVAAGIVHTYLLFPGADHLTLAGNDEYGPGATFLGDSIVDREPPVVSYVVDHSEDNAAAGMVADSAYWIGDIELADGADRGRVEADSRGVERTLTEQLPSAGVLSGGFQPAMPFIARGVAATGEQLAVGTDVLELELSGVSRLTVDVARAGLSCDAALSVQSDVTVRIRLHGCDREVVVAPVGA